MRERVIRARGSDEVESEDVTSSSVASDRPNSARKKISGKQWTSGSHSQSGNSMKWIGHARKVADGSAIGQIGHTAERRERNPMINQSIDQIYIPCEARSLR